MDNEEMEKSILNFYAQGKNCHFKNPAKALFFYNKALEICKEIEEGSINEANILSNKGSPLAIIGDIQEAQNCFEAALELEPKESSIWCSYGNFYAKFHRFDDAFYCYDKAIYYCPAVLEIDESTSDLVKVPNKREADIWITKSKLYYNINNFQDSVDCLSKALEINPHLLEIWHKKASILKFKLNKIEEYIVTLNQCLEINKQDAKAWYLKGLELFQLERYDEAMACFVVTVYLTPDNDDAWYWKGLVHNILGDYDEAVACFQKVIKINPSRDDMSTVLVKMGYSFLKLQDFKSAEKNFKSALKLDPNNSQARRCIKYIREQEVLKQIFGN